MIAFNFYKSEKCLWGMTMAVGIAIVHDTQELHGSNPGFGHVFSSTSCLLSKHI